MEKSRLSWSPQRAWLGYWEQVRLESTVVTVCRRQVAYYVGYMGRGNAAVRWVRRGRESRFNVDRGAVRLSPADGERHTLIASHSPGNAFYVCIIPKSQMAELADSENVVGRVEWQHLLRANDPILRWCMERLSASTPADENEADGRKDEAARRLMLRLLEANGGGTPSWRCDVSIFDRRTLDDLVTYIDEHLKLGLLLVDMGPLVGLSPSHFARKFRQSTGMSLHRFVNVRRIQASFALLRGNEVPLAHVAIDLGFASQSHFTRLFSELTGVSPGKYRRQFNRSVGWRASVATLSPPVAPPSGPGAASRQARLKAPCQP